MKRHIVIGDVHGCLDELEELLSIISPTNSDEVIFCGDLVDRGPNSVGVLHLVKKNNYLCVLGNHEEKHVRYRKWQNSGEKNPMHMPAYKHHEKYSQEDIDFMANMPSLKRFSVNKKDFIVVHAGFECTGVNPEYQKQSLIIRIRNINELGKQDEKSDTRWATKWAGQENVIYGHNVLNKEFPRMDISEYTDSFCLALDTGCVFGGKLSAFIINDDASYNVVSVNAKKDYWSHLKK